MTPQGIFEQFSRDTFVGRKRELTEIRAGLNDASAGHGRLFLLSGEPGIGKTRLAEEISSEAVARGMRVLWGRCWNGGGAPAYWPFIQILRECIESHDSEEWKALLGSGASEIVRLIPEIRFSLPSLAEPAATTDAESARFRLFDAVATFLKKISRNVPLLLVVDDLHEADQPSLEMSRFIARTTRDVSLLMIGTYRDSEVNGSPQLRKLVGELLREGRSFPLAGLSRAEVKDFISARMGGTADEKLVADLYRATDGNALHVEGVVRLLESKRMPETAAGERDRFMIPDGVRESIRKQLARLSSEANSLLSVASAIGNEFETRLLERVAERSREQVAEQMEEAVRIGVLRNPSPASASQRFAHALVRDVLYEELEANRRAELHREIGAAMEELYKSDLTRHLARLANHYRMAGGIEKAIEFSIDAGDAANAVFAYEDALVHWTQAKQLMERIGTIDERRAGLLERLGDALVITGADPSTALRYFESALRAFESLKQPEQAARIHTRLGIALSYGDRVTRDLRRALSHYRAAESILRDGPENTSLSLLYLGLAVADGGLALYEEGLAASTRAMEIARRIGNEHHWVHGALQHAYCLFFRGQLGESFELCKQAWEQADRLNDSVAAASAARIGATCCNLLWDPIGAERWLKLELDHPHSNLPVAHRDTLLGQMVIA